MPVDWKIDEETTVQPDNLVVCGELERTAYLSKTPTLIFEILSRATAKKDRVTKFKPYEQQGVRYYILVDPVARFAEVHHWQDGRYIKLLDASQETFEFDLGKCNVLFDFSGIWIQS